MKEIFISYRSTESNHAYMFKSFLETHGFSVWMAPDCIPGGSDYATEIPAAIRGCKAVVLILSKEAQRSKWVRKELAMAFELGKTVMPVMIEKCPLSQEYNFYLSNVQRYEAYADKAVVMKRLLDELCAITGREPFEEVVGGMDAFERAIKEAAAAEQFETWEEEGKNNKFLKSLSPFARKRACEPKVHSLLKVNTVVVLTVWGLGIMLYLGEFGLFFGTILALAGFLVCWYVAYGVALIVSTCKKKRPAMVVSAVLSVVLNFFVMFYGALVIM